MLQKGTSCDLLIITKDVKGCWRWGWNQLEKRRQDVRLALLFKVVHGHVEVTTDDLYLTKADSRTRANHPYKYRVKGANTKELQNFFYL